jgi:hypothetical protein
LTRAPAGCIMRGCVSGYCENYSPISISYQFLFRVLDVSPFCSLGVLCP